MDPSVNSPPDRIGFQTQTRQEGPVNPGPDRYTRHHMGGRGIICVLCGSAALAADATWLPTLPDLDLPDRATVAAWFPERAPVPGMVSQGVVTGFGGVRALGGEAVAGLGLGYQTGVSLTLGSPSAWVRPILAWYHVEARGDHPQPNQTVTIGTIAIQGFAQRVEREIRINEFAFGLAHGWRLGACHPGIAMGGSWSQVSLSETPSFTVLRQVLGDVPHDRTDTRSVLGGWATAGMQYAIGSGAVGVEVRYTYARTAVLEDALDAGGMQYGATAAWSW
jgi:hypothetical protein